MSQYFRKAYKGEESEKKRVCERESHFAVHLKLTQHCESTILQLKEKKVVIQK